METKQSKAPTTVDNWITVKEAKPNWLPRISDLIHSCIRASFWISDEWLEAFSRCNYKAACRLCG
jgi:hypothetical protein